MMSNFDTFMEAVKRDPRAKELVRGIKKPENDEEMAESYLSIAGALGFSLTKAEITEGLHTAMQEQKASSEKAAKAIEKARLDEDVLDQVAGGKNEGCDDTHTLGEWCWWTDSCFLIITDYGAGTYDANDMNRDSVLDNPEPQPAEFTEQKEIIE